MIVHVINPDAQVETTFARLLGNRVELRFREAYFHDYVDAVINKLDGGD
jgi:hypothetical protein